MFILCKSSGLGIFLNNKLEGNVQSLASNTPHIELI